MVQQKVIKRYVRRSFSYVTAGLLLALLASTCSNPSAKNEIKVQQPKDVQHISQEPTQAKESLRLLDTANNDLISLQALITTMKDSHLDTTAFEQQSNMDIQDLRQASTSDDINTIINHLNAQIISAQANSTQAIPYVGRANLRQFQDSIDAFQHYGGNSGPYQQMHDADMSLLANGNYMKFTVQIDADMKSLQLPLAKLQATHDFNQLMNETKSWGHAHQYHDIWNGNNYDEAYEYWNGTLYDIQHELLSTPTIDDYKSILSEVQLQTLLFRAQKANYDDHTPVTQVHQSDLNLMKHFNVSTAKVIVTSLIIDEVHVYQDGKLIRAIPVVTGAPEKPTPPGFTQIFKRVSPTTFTSFDQDIGSPFYYPATHINYAMEYHVGEYYYHDSWWRAADDYGLGKKFPHYAPAANNMGTHGCINMSLNNAQWLWDFTSGSQPVYSIVY